MASLAVQPATLSAMRQTLCRPFKDRRLQYHRNRCSRAYRPHLLETFVEQARFTGTCYQAANWRHVGQTKGRGKLGTAGKISPPIKDVWLYPLEKNSGSNWFVNKVVSRIFTFLLRLPNSNDSSCRSKLCPMLLRCIVCYYPIHILKRMTF
jgi:hypothetical protein